jgi:hypothetical protein
VTRRVSSRNLLVRGGHITRLTAEPEKSSYIISNILYIILYYIILYYIVLYYIILITDVNPEKGKDFWPQHVLVLYNNKHKNIVQIFGGEICIGLLPGRNATSITWPRVIS